MDRHGHIYVVDGMHHAMQVFDRDGQLLLAVGEQGREPGQFWLPSGVYATAQDLIFVADAFNRRVQVFRYVGEGS
jgi:DNA-binding beta-propeller fold protein YncE